jgi:hypothetical protein
MIFLFKSNLFPRFAPAKKPHGSGQLAGTCQMAQLEITSLNSHFAH